MCSRLNVTGRKTHWQLSRQNPRWHQAQGQGTHRNGDARWRRAGREGGGGGGTKTCCNPNGHVYHVDWDKVCPHGTCGSEEEVRATTKTVTSSRLHVVSRTMPNLISQPKSSTIILSLEERAVWSFPGERSVVSRRNNRSAPRAKCRFRLQNAERSSLVKESPGPLRKDGLEEGAPCCMCVIIGEAKMIECIEE